MPKRIFKDTEGRYILNSLPVKFPRIYENILEKWGSYELHDYFDELILSKREKRQGFPVDVMIELLDLYNIYKELYPKNLCHDKWAVDPEVARNKG